MHRSCFTLARQKRRVPTVYKAIPQPEKTKNKKQHKNPLICPTVSPWVWASGDVKEEEYQCFTGKPINQASRYFDFHGPRSRFVPPNEFSYEVC